MGWRVSRMLLPPFQAIVDFLIADRCLLCRRDRTEAAGAAFLPVCFTDALAAGQELKLGGLVRLVNHPVCPACSGAFEAAPGPGRLAVVDEEGALLLSDGSRFEVGRPGREDETAAAGAEPPREIRVIAPFRTNDPVLQLIHLLKFSGYRYLARLLAGAMAAAVRRFGPLEGRPIVVPVPMERLRRRRRGFNQAELVGRELAGELGLSLNTRMLRRIRRGVQQSITPGWERAANVRGAFAAEPALATGRHLALVDDLVTSGSTAAACAAALLAAGAASVEVLCFGRARWTVPSSD